MFNLSFVLSRNISKFNVIEKINLFPYLVKNIIKLNEHNYLLKKQIKRLEDIKLNTDIYNLKNFNN